MKLWLLERTDAWGYDDYDSVVVAAETEMDAREITPDGQPFGAVGSSWAITPECVKITLIGDAAHGMAAGVVLASFNAG